MPNRAERRKRKREKTMSRLQDRIFAAETAQNALAQDQSVSDRVQRESIAGADVGTSSEVVEVGRAEMVTSGEATPATELRASQRALIVEQPEIVEEELEIENQVQSFNRENLHVEGETAAPSQTAEGSELDLCEFCKLHILPKENTKENQIQRYIHTFECRSKNTVCNICYEIVSEKSNPKSRAFGLLENCTHAFCVDCIYHWRRTGTVPLEVRKSCPICREPSVAIYTTVFWTDSEKIRNLIIQIFKDTRSQKDCKWFKKGRGLCPFAAKCFFRHRTEDGLWEGCGPSIFDRGYDDYTGVMKWFSAYNRGKVFLRLLSERESSTEDEFLEYPERDNQSI